MEFALLVLDWLGTCYPFLLSNFSLLEWECLFYACPTIVFRLCLGSTELVWFHRFTAGEEFCLRMNESYLESHPYLA